MATLGIAGLPRAVHAECLIDSVCSSISRSLVVFDLPACRLMLGEGVRGHTGGRDPNTGRLPRSQTTSVSIACGSCSCHVDVRVMRTPFLPPTIPATSTVLSLGRNMCLSSLCDVRDAVFRRPAGAEYRRGAQCVHGSCARGAWPRALCVDRRPRPFGLLSFVGVVVLIIVAVIVLRDRTQACWGILERQH